MVKCEKCDKEVRRRVTYQDQKLCKECAEAESVAAYLALSAFIMRDDKDD